jgi:hypothetical protein
LSLQPRRGYGPGQDGRDDMVAEGEQRGDGAGGARCDMIAAGRPGLSARPLAVNPAAVNPPGAGATASASDGATRIRALFRSMPAILPASVWTGSGPAFT